MTQPLSPSAAPKGPNNPLSPLFTQAPKPTSLPASQEFSRHLADPRQTPELRPRGETRPVARRTDPKDNNLQAKRSDPQRRDEPARSAKPTQRSERRDKSAQRADAKRSERSDRKQASSQDANQDQLASISHAAAWGAQSLSLFNPALSAYATPEATGEAANFQAAAGWSAAHLNPKALGLMTPPGTPLMAGSVPQLETGALDQGQTMMGDPLLANTKLSSEEALLVRQQLAAKIASTLPNAGTPLSEAASAAPTADMAQGFPAAGSVVPDAANGLAGELSEGYPAGQSELPFTGLSDVNNLDSQELSQNTSKALTPDGSQNSSQATALAKGADIGAPAADLASDPLSEQVKQLLTTQNGNPAPAGSSGSEGSGLAQIVAANRFNQMNAGELGEQRQAPSATAAGASNPGTNGGFNGSFGAGNSFGSNQGGGFGSSSGSSSGGSGGNSSGSGSGSSSANGTSPSGAAAAGSTGTQLAAVGDTPRAENRPLGTAETIRDAKGLTTTSAKPSEGSSSRPAGELSPALKQSILSHSIRLAGGGGTANVTLQTGTNGPLGVTVAVGGGNVDIQLATADEELGETLAEESPALIEALKRQLPGQEIALKVTPAEEASESFTQADEQPDFSQNDNREKPEEGQFGQDNRSIREAAGKPTAGGERAKTRYEQRGDNHTGQLYQRV